MIQCNSRLGRGEEGACRAFDFETGLFAPQIVKNGLKGPKKSVAKRGRQERFRPLPPRHPEAVASSIPCGTMYTTAVEKRKFAHKKSRPG